MEEGGVAAGDEHAELVDRSNHGLEVLVASALDVAVDRQARRIPGDGTFVFHHQRPSVGDSIAEFAVAVVAVDAVAQDIAGRSVILRRRADGAVRNTTSPTEPCIAASGSRTRKPSLL